MTTQLDTEESPFLPRSTARTDEKDMRFFEGLASGLTVKDACAVVGYGRTSVYDWRRDDEAFAHAWHMADADSLDVFLKEVDRRGKDGVEEPVFYQGEIVGTIQRYSDALLMFRVKQKDPSYRENARPLIGDGAQVQITQVTYVLDRGERAPIDTTGSVVEDDSLHSARCA